MNKFINNNFTINITPTLQNFTWEGGGRNTLLNKKFCNEINKMIKIKT